MLGSVPGYISLLLDFLLSMAISDEYETQILIFYFFTFVY